MCTEKWAWHRQHVSSAHYITCNLSLSSTTTCGPILTRAEQVRGVKPLWSEQNAHNAALVLSHVCLRVGYWTEAKVNKDLVWVCPKKKKKKKTPNKKKKMASPPTPRRGSKGGRG